MPNYTYLKNTPNFTIKSYKGKNFVFWNATEKKMLKSETWIKDYKAQYQFELDNGDILSLSKDQTGQMMVNALEVGKPLAGLSFEAKTNGKTGLDTRWFINLSKASPSPISSPKKSLADELNAQSNEEISEPPF